MATIEVLPATADRWSDVQLAVGHGDGSSCWCQWFWLTGGEFGALRTPERRERLRTMTGRDPAPGLIAYVDGKPAGWCGLGRRDAMRRLERSRTIPKLDDSPVWSVVCFLVRKEFRSMKVTEALLAAVIDYASQHGVTALEAYPADTGGMHLPAAAGYVGILSVFQRFGFTEVAKTTSKSGGVPRVVVRLDLRT